MNLDAFELGKQDLLTYAAGLAREMKILSYGRVTKVYDDQTVEVEQSVQNTVLTKQVYTLTLLSLSSALFEAHIQPVVGDSVLILGLDRYNPDMFREVSIVDKAETAYTAQSLVGILLRPFNMQSAFQIDASIDNGIPVADFSASGDVNIRTGRNTSIEVFSADGEKRTLGITVQPDVSVQQVINAPVTAVYGIQNQDGEDVEVDAPVSTVYSNKAPISQDIRGSVDLTVGTGADGAVDAPVSITLDEKSDVAITSKAGLKLAFKKAFELVFDDIINFGSKKDVTVESGATLTLKGSVNLILASGDASPWMPNIVPVCPLGIAHGGPTGGIVKLKGQ